MIFTSIFSVFFLAYFGGSLTGYGFIPSEFTILTEVFVYLLVILSLFAKRKKNYDLSLVYLFIFLVLAGLCSAFVNHGLNLRIIFSLRLILRFYVFYLALINLKMDDRLLKKLNAVLFAFFILQILASAIKFRFYGISELTMGTYAVRGGGPTTLIPIIGLGFLTGFYVLHKPRKIYFLLAAGFIFYGIAGAKKSLFVLFPITFIGLYFLIYIKARGYNPIRDGIRICGIFAVILITLLFQMKYVPELNVEKEGGGRIDLSYTIEFLKNYTTKKNGSSQTAIGRTATTGLIFKELNDHGIEKWFFGFGPGSFTGSMFDTKPFINQAIINLQRSYGITGASYILIEYGLFGVICIGMMFIIFIFKSWQWYNIEKDPYWRAFSAGTLVFAILDTFIFFFYSVLVVMDDIITPTFFYAMAVMHTKSIQLKSQERVIAP